MESRVFRAVVIHRPTDYQLLLAAHGTRGQAEFFLKTRQQTIEQAEQDHQRIQTAIESVMGNIPARWRRASISRPELNRFLFEPDDVIIAIGQDGLVANVAKYLSGQLVVGVNPIPDRFDGVLVRHSVAAAQDVFYAIDTAGRLAVQERTMVEASLDDGQKLLALNEIFVGHRSHESARYRIGVRDKQERQSSSGLICCTGTGATGWASSIHRATAAPIKLPGPTDPLVCYFVREAWPGKGIGTSITMGQCAPSDRLVVNSEMNQGGVIFGDGIEDDYLPFDWGRVASIGIASQRLRLAE